MTYYVRESLAPDRPVLSARRASIHECYLSSYTLNIYVGCEYGCPYCDGWIHHARPLNEVVRIPLDLPQRLAETLTKVDRGDLVGITALSDPYQPAEQTYRMTRKVLQVFADVGQPVLILTKSEKILDDLSVLQRIHERSLAVVVMTILSHSERVAQVLEGKCAPPQVRLETVKRLKQAGLPAGVAIIPLMPYINDTDHALSSLLQKCVEAGADFVLWSYLRILGKSHFYRIGELLPRLGYYPAKYYRDLYRDGNEPAASYLSEMHARMLAFCDTLTLPVRVPHRVFAGRLSPANEAALVLQHTAFRDAVQGRNNMAAIHRSLADLVYQGRCHTHQLRVSPLYPTIKRILAREGDAHGSAPEGERATNLSGESFESIPENTPGMC